MSRKGHYNGGGTTFGPQDQTWFGHSKPKKTKSNSPRKRKLRSPGLIAIEFAEFKKTGMTPSEFAKRQTSLAKNKRPK